MSEATVTCNHEDYDESCNICQSALLQELMRRSKLKDKGITEAMDLMHETLAGGGTVPHSTCLKMEEFIETYGEDKWRR